jgi:superfamily II DNA/RNA helicase
MTKRLEPSYTMSNSQSSARPRSGARTVYSSDTQSDRPAKRDDAFSTGVFSVGAFSNSLRANGNAPTGDRPASSRSADRLNRTADAPTGRGSRGSEGRSNDGRRRRQRGSETSGKTGGRPAAQSARGTESTRHAPAGQSRRAPSTRRPAVGPAQNTAPSKNTLFPVAARRIQAVEGQASASFAELGVPANLLPVLTTLGAVSPFPIQEATLPATLQGRDVLGRGKTGSGKTIAFAIPLVTRLTGGRRVSGRPRGLILLPTRELALQVARTVEPLAAAAGLRTVVIFGGVGYGNQTAALRNGVDIVIACPGRLEDLVNQKACDLGGIEVTVLDEADHMADLGFLPVVRRLLRATPANGQRLLFSATLDNGISVLVKEFLTDPILHAVDDETSPVESMAHHVFAVSSGDRNQVIRELAAGGGRRMLFTRTKHSAKKWAAALTKQGIPAVDLHGNLSQNARERNLAAFSSGSAKVLVATDIAARGIHVDDVELVVHLDPPTEHKAYLHRSGRTARAGAGGTVITVMLPDQAADLRKLMKQAGISPSTTQVAPGHPAIGKIAG